MLKLDTLSLAYKGTDKVRLGVFSLSENSHLRFFPTADPIVLPMPALQSNMEFECMCMHQYTEREGASTPAIHYVGIVFGFTSEINSESGQETFSELVTALRAEYCQLLDKTSLHSIRCPSPQADPSFPTSHRLPETRFFRLFQKLFPVLFSQKQ